MMHVQLINESQYNKENKIKIHSLCFYYRNHKHVLYGSFTINDEVFIFSFNIFDIYRSYHSKSNKKTSKSHKTSSNSAPSKASSSQKSSCSKNLQTTPTSVVPLSASISSCSKTMETNEFKNSEISEFITQDVSLFGEGVEFQKYMNNIIKIDSNIRSSKDTLLQHQLSSENSTKNNSDDACEQKETKNTGKEELKSKAEINQSQLNSFLNSNKNPYFDNMFSLILNSENQKINQNTKSFDLFTFPKSQQVNLSKQIGSFQTALNVQSVSKSVPSLNLSNFLNVRFEIIPNNTQNTNDQTSKSKSKYKKSIKILTVSCRPLNALYSNEPDIQLKSYEFTEKCLSFRLASIDLSSEVRTSFEIKLINLYEKYLCALVNFKSVRTGNYSFKLYKIKHEETNSNSSNMTNNNGLSLSSEIKVKVTDLTENTILSPSCLAATSSSRLNLTEFIFTTLSNNHNNRIMHIMPVSVSIMEDEDSDLKFVAILNENGLISILDPNKCCKVIEFSSPNDDKFVNMIYCYGKLW